MLSVTGKRRLFSTPATRATVRDLAVHIGRVEATSARVSSAIRSKVSQSPATPYVAVATFYGFIHAVVSAVEQITL